MAVDEPAEPRDADPGRNSVRPTRAQQASLTSESQEPGESPKVATRAVPEPIAKRFIRVKNRYYFPDGTRAFTDRGNRLTTLSENTEVVRSLVGIAQARGWHDLHVRGTERFRREVWFAAAVVGLKVEGY